MPTVQVGTSSLILDGPGGTLIEPGVDGEDPAALAEALDRPRVGPVAKQIFDAAEEATARAEEAVDLTRALLDGSLLDLAKESARIELILSVLERLDRDGKHKEALQLARAVNGLLALWGFVEEGTILTKAGHVGVIYRVKGIDAEALTHAQRYHPPTCRTRFTPTSC